MKWNRIVFKLGGTIILLFLVVLLPVGFVIDQIFSGLVKVLASTEGIKQSVQDIRDLLVLAGIGAFFLALGLTFVISRKLSNPLIQMEEATRKIAKGNLETRVQVISGDEIGSLAHAINDLALDLQRYRDTRSEFLANISHELRTPMTYLEGYAKVVKEGLYETEEERNRYLDIIHQETFRLSHLIHDLFELSKMEEGKIGLNMEWIDLVEVIENVTLKAELKAREKGLEIKAGLQRDLPMVYADGLRMEQIILNLMDNAIRYTEKGSITVQTKRANANEITIVIEDTGIGIPKHELSKIYERFHRVEKSRSREYGGTGLGLAIVKRLVELQNGTIEVSSEVHRGTRFTMTFPIKAKEGG